ncbi:MAG: hypothetical protein P8J78_09235 [Maricaulis sp.]|jgi:hypothetical protein|nr:hypothetical protein [Maricaulis sp.]MDG2044781.1 hypothetical protein [Maricaulis sp.]
MTPHVQISVSDIQQIVWTLVDLHGPQAIGYADEAVSDLDQQGSPESADAWRALKSVMEDALAGRLEREGEWTIH